MQQQQVNIKKWKANETGALQTEYTEKTISSKKAVKTEITKKKIQNRSKEEKPETKGTGTFKTTKHNTWTFVFSGLRSLREVMLVPVYLNS